MIKTKLFKYNSKNYLTDVHKDSDFYTYTSFSLRGNSRLPDQEVEKLSTFMVEEFYLLNQLTF